MDERRQPLGVVKFWSPKDDWYYLAAAERRGYFDAYRRALENANQSGARLNGIFKCRGQSRWSRFEVWEFPDLETLVRLTDELEEIGHFQYFAEETTFGRRYVREEDEASWVI